MPNCPFRGLGLFLNGWAGGSYFVRRSKGHDGRRLVPGGGVEVSNCGLKVESDPLATDCDDHAMTFRIMGDHVKFLLGSGGLAFNGNDSRRFSGVVFWHVSSLGRSWLDKSSLDESPYVSGSSQPTPLQLFEFLRLFVPKELLGQRTEIGFGGRSFIFLPEKERLLNRWR